MKVRVNDIELELEPGTSAIDAVFAAGHDVPYFCSQEYMSPIGACRMCLARVGAPRKDRDGNWIMDEETGERQIFWFPNPMATCTTTIMEGMVIDTLSDSVRSAQDHMVELTLINHPLDCPTCDKGGACELQDRSYEYGNGLSRFQFAKRQSEKHHPLSQLITLDRERCIHCKRCVRYFEEVPGDEVLDFIERGGHTYIGTAEEHLPGNFTGNITDICPVGALLDTTSRFRGRNWEYDHVRSTSPNDASGSGIIIDARTGRIERIRAGLNTEVNKTWIDDGVRFGHEHTDAPDRIRTPLIRRDGELTEATWAEAAAFIAERLNSFAAGQTGIVLRADSTLEEGVGARQLAEKLATPNLDHQPRPRSSVLPEFRTAPATFTDLATADAIFVIGDPTEEVPLIDLRIRDALKGVPPAELLPHGVPIADLRLKEQMPLQHERLTVAAPYRTNLMRIAGTGITYRAGGERELLSTLAALASGRETEASDELRQAAAELRKAERPVIVYGGLVLDDPEAVTMMTGILRATGAKPMIMGPAANSFGLELSGVLPGDKGSDFHGMLDGRMRGLIISQLDPALSPDVKDVLSRTELVVLHTMFHGDGTEVADVVLPALSGLEKEGTFINLEGRALPVRPAPTDAGDALDFTGVVRWLGEALGERLEGRSIRSGRRQLHREFGLDFSELPDEGMLLDLSARKFMERRARAAAKPAQADAGNGVEFEVLITPSMLRHEYLERNHHLLADRGFTPLTVNAADAARLDLKAGDQVSLNVAGLKRRAEVRISDSTPEGVLLLPAIPEQTSGLRRAAAATLRHERQALEVI